MFDVMHSNNNDNRPDEYDDATQQPFMWNQVSDKSENATKYHMVLPYLL